MGKQLNEWSNEEAHKDYDLYLDKYCVKHHLSKEEAEKHQLIRDVKRFYMERSAIYVCNGLIHQGINQSF